MIDAIGVVVPVHNEEALLGECLFALREAFRKLPPHIHRTLVVVLDACSDRSLEVARAACGSLPAHFEIVRHQNVGLARADGARRALSELARFCWQSVWLATTDADSAVPPDWLLQHLKVAGDGAHAIAGLVRVDDWSDHPSGRVREYLKLYEKKISGATHAHVHGANLGVRADAYLEVGGFGALRTGEDHALWRALRNHGKRLVSSTRLCVSTSARQRARAPHGFAHFVSSLKS